MNVHIIGSGFAGLSAACFLAKEGAVVTVIEKNEQPGGRARSFSAKGFTFDMGPSWYWMPDVFEKFFSQFGKHPKDYYDLLRLDPSYKVFTHHEEVDIPAAYSDLRSLFEKYEPGSAVRLDQFLDQAKHKYEQGVGNLVYKPGLSVTEFMNLEVLKGVLKLDLLSSIHRHVRKYFNHPLLLQLAEFPVLFLGALPRDTPSLYSLMNYADMIGGTWYPSGGMVKVVQAMYQVALDLGVEFKFNEAVTAIECEGKRAISLHTEKGFYPLEYLVNASDYEHCDQHLLPAPYRHYSESYWNSRKLAPSCLIYYLGIGKKIVGLEHHNLFFDADFDAHAEELYTTPKWPEDPLMYVCSTSKTDPSVAPEGCENLFILIPVATALVEQESTREQYLNLAIMKMEKRFNTAIKEHILYQRSYAGKDFIADYNAYKGNAYGLANTLLQTALLKPSIKNKNLNNLYYTGQLTVPGPGVPPALISGQVTATELMKQYHKQTSRKSAL